MIPIISVFMYENDTLQQFSTSRMAELNETKISQLGVMRRRSCPMGYV